MVSGSSAGNSLEPTRGSGISNRGPSSIDYKDVPVAGFEILPASIRSYLSTKGLIGVRNPSGRMRHSVVLDVSESLLDRRIDPDDFGDDGSLRRDAAKADRIQLERGGQRGLSLLSNLGMGAVVH